MPCTGEKEEMVRGHSWDGPASVSSPEKQDAAPASPRVELSLCGNQLQTSMRCAASNWVQPQKLSVSDGAADVAALLLTCKWGVSPGTHKQVPYSSAAVCLAQRPEPKGQVPSAMHNASVLSPAHANWSVLLCCAAPVKPGTPSHAPASAKHSGNKTQLP